MLFLLVLLCRYYPYLYERRLKTIKAKQHIQIYRARVGMQTQTQDSSPQNKLVFYNIFKIVLFDQLIKDG